jgi:hypothetical protein
VTSPAPRGLPLTFYSVAEPEPGPGWQGLFSSAWPAYRRWYLRDGAAARTGLRECQRMMATHMPELMPTWRRLVELAGGDPLAAQMLTLYNPPPYITGCSQAVHLGAERALVRNYDYAPELFERVVLGSSFTGRQVVGTSDCLWGLVDDPDLDLEQLVGRFLEPPLHCDAYELGFGTLYTAVYRPAELAIDCRWPGWSWKHTIGSFADGQHEVVLGAP